MLHTIIQFSKSLMYWFLTTSCMCSLKMSQKMMWWFNGCLYSSLSLLMFSLHSQIPKDVLFWCSGQTVRALHIPGCHVLPATGNASCRAAREKNMHSYHCLYMMQSKENKKGLLHSKGAALESMLGYSIVCSINDAVNWISLENNLVPYFVLYTV